MTSTYLRLLVQVLAIWSMLRGTDADPELVSLPLPHVTFVKYTNPCQSVADRCDLTIGTRAAEYSIAGIDVQKGIGGTMTRTGAIKTPGPIYEQQFQSSDAFLQEQEAYDFRRGKMITWLKDTYPSAIHGNASLPAVLQLYTDSTLCPIYIKTTPKGRKNYVEVCIRDNIYKACFVEMNGKCNHGILDMNTCSNEPLPFTREVMLPLVAGAGWTNGFENGDATRATLNMMLVDAVGRVFPRLTANIDFLDSILTMDYKYGCGKFAIGTVELKTEQGLTVPPWKEVDPLGKKQDLMRLLTEDLDTKLGLSYVSAISVGPNSDAICWASGFNFDGNRMLECKRDGADKSTIAPQYKFKDPSSSRSLIVYAAHHQPFADKKVSHIVAYYSRFNIDKSKESALFYIWCLGDTYADVTLDGNLPTTCTREEVWHGNDTRAIPNDIVGISNEQDKCERVMAIYDFVYTSHYPDRSIYSTEPKSPAYIMPALNFYIDAMYIDSGIAYMFTQSNTLVTATASLKDCEELVIGNDKKEQVASTHLYELALGKTPQWPQIVGWMDFADKANDTTPSIFVSPPKPPKPAPGPVEEDGSSTVVIVIIVSLLIIFAVTAGAVYLLCYQTMPVNIEESATRPSDNNRRAAASSSPPPPGSKIETHATVRSNLASAVGQSNASAASKAATAAAALAAASKSRAKSRTSPASPSSLKSTKSRRSKSPATSARSLSRGRSSKSPSVSPTKSRLSKGTSIARKIAGIVKSTSPKSDATNKSASPKSISAANKDKLRQMKTTIVHASPRANQSQPTSPPGSPSRPN